MLSSASNPSTPLPSQPNSVYQYFDAHKILIYVGITGSRSARNRQHNTDKAWWPFVLTQTVEHFDSRDLAHAREVELIQKFRPPFNKQHNHDYAELRGAYLRLQESGRLSGVTAKELLSIQGKRSITLLPVQDDVRVCFLTHLEDRPITECLRHNPNVPVYLGDAYLGGVKGLEAVNGLVKVITNVAPAKRYSIMRAEARLRFITQEAPFVLELRRIAASL